MCVHNGYNFHYQYILQLPWDVRLREECYNGLFLRFRMYGLFQTTFYFGYMALFSLTLGVMCGKYHFTATTHAYLHACTCKYQHSSKSVIG